MLKKVLAGLTAFALALGMAALTAAPASATVADDCHTFDRSELTWNWNDTVVVSFQGVTLTKPAGGHNNIAVAGSPSSIAIFSNGGTQDRTGHTVLNGDYGSDIQWVKVCVPPPPPPPPVDPTPYVLVAWIMPSWVDATTPTWSQTYFTKVDLATKDLHALDGQLTACGTHYQVDLYDDSATTTALIAGGVLHGPNNPPEDFPSPSGWGVTYKLIQNADCETTPNPATFAAAGCVAGSPGQGSYTIPSTTGVRYTVQINGAGGFVETAAGTYPVSVGTTVEVTAEALPGHTLIGQIEWSTTIAKPDCRVTPLPPNFTPAVCSTSDPGHYGKASYTIPTTEGVKYQVRVNGGSWTDKSAGTYEVSASAYVEVRATAVPGYKLTGTLKWTKHFKAPDCLTDVTPSKPTKTQAVCTGDEQVGPASFTIPDITGITYQRLVGFTWVDLAPGSHMAVDGSLVIVRAVPLPGFELTDHDGNSNKKTYLLYFDNLKASKDCIVPDEPGFDPQVCEAAGEPSQATFTVPSDSGVKYRIWTGAAWVPIPAGTYDVDTFPTWVTIKAVPVPGHQFLPGAKTLWHHKFTSAGDCIEEVTATPATAVDQTCVEDQDGKGTFVSGYLVIPNTPNVDYFVDGSVTPATPGNVDKAPGTYWVSAVAHPGYVLVGYTGPWPLEIEKADACGQLVDLPVVDPIVTFTPTTCVASGGYTLAVDPPELPDGVVWTVTGGLPNTLGSHSVTTAGTVTVTATPAAGYGFTGFEPELEWSFDYAAKDDCLPTLALTGGSTALGGLGLATVLTLGGFLLIGARQRVGRSAQ